MKRLFAAIACALLVSACATTTVTRIADKNLPKPSAGSKILLVQPDVSLKILTVSGLGESRADWSQSGRDNLAAELKVATAGRSHEFRELDPSTALNGKVGQLIRLHEAVGTSIMTYDYGVLPLPTKKDAFDRTLGEGAQAVGQAYDADYALFTYGKGSYSSAGRKAMMVGMSLLGVSVPMGGQTVFASLVDLKTGRVIWFGVAAASADADMRDPDGARKLVTSLLRTAPL